MGFPSNWETCREAPGPGPPVADTPRPASSAGSHAQAPPPPRAADVSGLLARHSRGQTTRGVAGEAGDKCTEQNCGGGDLAFLVLRTERWGRRARSPRASPRAPPPPHAAPRSLGRRVPGRAPARPPAAQRAEGPGATTLLPAFVPGALGARPAAEPPAFLPGPRVQRDLRAAHVAKSSPHPLRRSRTSLTYPEIGYLRGRSRRTQQCKAPLGGE